MSTTTEVPEFTTLREKIAWEKQQRAERYAAFERLFDAAQEVGRTAGEAVRPTPMIVGTPSTPLGSDIDPTKPVYYESEGACGFAWILIRPGTSSFARWLVSTGRASKSYLGGVQIFIGAHGQSAERKAAHAEAMAEVFRASYTLIGSGSSIYSQSRLD